MKILFVDDEQIIRNSIRSVIDWEQIGCEKLDVAANYNQAVSMLEQEQYDLVISDIVMQRKMDGINLSKYIRMNYKETKVILLSAHEDFSMARGAIEADVIQYLLKPVVPQELEDAVRAATAEIHKGRQIQSDLIELEKQVNLYKNVAVDSVWRELLEPTGMSQVQLDKMIQTAGLGQFHGQVACVVIRCTGLQRDSVHLVCLNNLPNVIGHLFLYENEYVMIISVPCDSGNLRNLRVELQNHGAENLFVICGEYVGSISELSTSYKDARLKLAMFFALKAESPESQQEYELSSVELSEEAESCMRDIKVSILYNGKRLSDRLEKYYELISVQDNPKATAVLEGKLLYMLSEMASEKDRMSSFEGLIVHFFSIRTAEQRKQFIRTFIRNNIEIDETVLTSPELIAQNAKKYIDENFSDRDLTVGAIADNYHITGAYLSRLFKQYFDVTCISYVTQVRIDFAKRCLTNTDMRVSDISVKAGYANVYYFSIQFKKIVGMTPGEYRKKRMENR